MYYVKVEGKTLKDLKQGLERHLQELSGYGDSQSVTVKTKEEEYEEVQSPFATPVLVEEEVVEAAVGLDGQLDSEGIPWDERIHASSKALVKGGVWRTKRGVDENLVFQIKQQYRNHTSHANVPVVQTEPAAPVTVVTPVVQAAPVVVPIPTMQSSGHTLETFKSQFPMIIATLITNGKIDQNYVNSLKEYFKLSEIWMANDEQKAQVFDQFVQYGFVQKV